MTAHSPYTNRHDSARAPPQVIHTAEIIAAQDADAIAIRCRLDLRCIRECISSAPRCHWHASTRMTSHRMSRSASPSQSRPLRKSPRSSYLALDQVTISCMASDRTSFARYNPRHRPKHSRVCRRSVYLHAVFTRAQGLALPASTKTCRPSRYDSITAHCIHLPKSPARRRYNT